MNEPCDQTPALDPRPKRLPRALKVGGVLLLLAFGALALAYPRLLRTLGGDGVAPQPGWESTLSPAAQALLARTFDGLESDALVDVHTHLVGLGAGGTGCEVHPHMRSWSNPVGRVQFDLYLAAAGIQEEGNADGEYCERLGALLETSPRAGRFCLLAFDHAYLPDGSLDPAHSEFHTPNEYVFEVADRLGERALPVMSVHPYRTDALEELERWSARGGRMVKWLPNAMGIDPASSACDAYYDKLVELDLTLLTHTGEEKAVDADERQVLGNPLRLRRALNRGVRVVAAHCASLGEDLDLDMPAGKRVQRSSFDLFLRLMDEEQYEGLLFGEISAMTQINRIGRPLETMLARRDLHGRLLNGSDYPLPAINAVIHLGPLVKAGLLAQDQVEPLREIFRAHPLVFDLALKRSLRDPESGQGFAVSVFEAPAAFRF